MSCRWGFILSFTLQNSSSPPFGLSTASVAFSIVCIPAKNALTSCADGPGLVSVSDLSELGVTAVPASVPSASLYLC